VSNFSRTVVLLGIVACLLTQLQPAVAQEPREVAVTLSSGRTFTGTVDRLTNNDTLWLRMAVDEAVVRRPIAKDAVRSLQTASGPVTWTDVLKLAADDHVQESTAGERVVANRASASRDTQRPSVIAQAPARVATLRADAQVGHWDADAPLDGLLVYVTPLDALGRPLAVTGTVEITWTGFRPRSTIDPPSRGEKITMTLGNWTETLPAADDAHPPYLLRLPFQQFDPDREPNVPNYSLVHVKLIVPGHGIYSTTVDGVRVRQWAPFRDALRHVDGR
jgi:hypothetical protein